MEWLNIDTWNRKEHFNFFKTFEEPFFGVCVNVDCTDTYNFAKSSENSFFLLYLHKLLTAVNDTAAFRYRIEQGKVAIHDRIDASTTINRENNTFGFAYLQYAAEFDDFKTNALNEIEGVKNGDGLFPAASYTHLIHFSPLPWLQFTSVSHARKFSSEDSVPKISTGKLFEQNGIKLMPISVHVHHALMDGRDVAAMLDTFQQLLSD